MSSHPDLVRAAARGVLLDASDLIPGPSREPVDHWTEQLADRLVDMLLPDVGRYLRDRVAEDLRGDDRDLLEGALGEAIADAAGSYGLEFVSVADLAEGICSWLCSELGAEA